jgi:hypothetical protein
MAKFKIYAGLGGGFGGSDYLGIHEFPNEDEAFDYAYESASEEYDGYAGLHGLRDRDEIIQEFIEQGFELDEEEIDIAYSEEKESWLDYDVKQVPDDYEEDEDDY